MDCPLACSEYVNFITQSLSVLYRQSTAPGSSVSGRGKKRRERETEKQTEFQSDRKKRKKKLNFAPVEHYVGLNHNHLKILSITQLMMTKRRHEAKRDGN